MKMCSYDQNAAVLPFKSQISEKEFLKYQSSSKHFVEIGPSKFLGQKSLVGESL